jgi:iron complex transport system substrate-binding protein
VISFAPSITETLFALGLGDRVAGVTRYCKYPPAVKSLPQIGGYVDPNFEMILSLRPDLVLLLKEHSSLADFLRKNGISYKTIDNESFDAILQSFRTIGGLFGKTKEADSLVASIKAEIVETPALNRPKILLCIGRDSPGSGAIAKVYVAGPKSFYSRLINYAGGTNAYADSSFAYPSLSAEGIIRLGPDIILDLMASVAGMQQDKVRADWKGLTMVPAVKNGLVFCPDDDYMTIPGPRLGMILREMKRAIGEYRNQSGK